MRLVPPPLLVLESDPARIVNELWKTMMTFLDLLPRAVSCEEI